MATLELNAENRPIFARANAIEAYATLENSLWITVTVHLIHGDSITVTVHLIHGD